MNMTQYSNFQVFTTQAHKNENAVFKAQRTINISFYFATIMVWGSPFYFLKYYPKFHFFKKVILH